MSTEDHLQEPENKEYIKRFESKNDLFGITFQSSKSNIVLGLSSMNISTNNQIEIIEYNNESDKLEWKSSIKCEFPCSKILFSPEEQSAGLLASTSDNLRLYTYTDSKLSLQTVMPKTSQNFSGPLTSCDWSKANPSILGVSSIDTTCTIWDINKIEVKTIFIAHDKEVYDISLGPDEFTFMTTGADGSLRLFDTRQTDSCNILFETPDQTPMTLINWNLINPNFIIAGVLDKNEIYIIDQRNNNTPYAILKDHTNVVNNAIWAPKSSTNLCSVSDDKTALIWDIHTETSKQEESIMSYTAQGEIENVFWGDYSQEWIGITYGNSSEILRIKK